MNTLLLKRRSMAELDGINDPSRFEHVIDAFVNQQLQIICYQSFREACARYLVVLTGHFPSINNEKLWLACGNLSASTAINVYPDSE